MLMLKVKRMREPVIKVKRMSVHSGVINEAFK